MTSPPPRRWSIALIAALLALILSSCSFLIIAAPGSVPAGGIARYLLELHNDAVTNTGLSVFTVAHVPLGWSLSGATFDLTVPPVAGQGSEVVDPAFVCTTGSLPSPDAGQKRVVVSWGTFDAINPQTATARLSFAVGQLQGDFPVDFFVVLQKAISTACSAAQSTTTRVEEAIFFDGFESGNTGAWV